MDQRTIQILFALLRSAICGTKLTKEERNNYSSVLLHDLLKISSKHDVVHLLVLGLKQNDLVAKGNVEIEKCILKAVYRYERLRYEYENLCSALEKAQIPFLPLKGSVIRKYYPEAWMRTSCDIDVLVHEENSEKAKSILVDEYGYVYHGKGSHDISLFAPTNTHIELHYDLVEDGIANESSEVLKNVWSVSTVRDGYAFWHEMPDEYYYFYHIAHMAKHFENGGCGIRPFLDLWILNHCVEHDAQKRRKLLSQGGMLTFAQAAEKLSEVWFSDLEKDLLSAQLERFILDGGVYGNLQNQVAVQQTIKGSKLKYALSKIFLSYDVIKFHYPILQKHRWLTPLFEVRRWIKLIFTSDAKRSLRTLKTNAEISPEQISSAADLLKYLGL